MAYLQTPPEAGPSIVQVTSGLQNWKCAGRRLVEIGGRLPTIASVLHQDTLRAFGCEQEGEFCVSAAVKHYTHDESKSNRDCGTLLICGSYVDSICHSCRTLPRSKLEVAPDEHTKGETQIPRPKPKAQPKGNSPNSPAKVESKPPDVKKGGKGGGKGKRGKSEPRMDKRKQQCIHFFRGTCQKGEQCRYEHQVGDDGQPVPVGPEILQV